VLYNFKKIQKSVSKIQSRRHCEAERRSNPANKAKMLIKRNSERWIASLTLAMTKDFRLYNFINFTTKLKINKMSAQERTLNNKKMKKSLTIIMLCGFISCYAQNTPPYAASAQTWTFGNQTWSDAIHMPGCNKESLIDLYDPDCCSYTTDGKIVNEKIEKK
jgi:hypothetical protein